MLDKHATYGEMYIVLFLFLVSINYLSKAKKLAVRWVILKFNPDVANYINSQSQNIYNWHCPLPVSIIVIFFTSHLWTLTIANIKFGVQNRRQIGPNLYMGNFLRSYPRNKIIQEYQLKGRMCSGLAQLR